MPALYVKATHITILAEWRSEVEKLPKRKQAKWCTKVILPPGTWHKVRFNNGYFELKVHEETLQAAQFTWPKDGWAPVMPLKGKPEFEQIERAYGTEAATVFFTKWDAEDPNVLVLHREIFDAAGDAETVEGRNARQMVATQIIMDSHTGNHYRNKHLNIPTSAGQPVRG